VAVGKPEDIAPATAVHRIGGASVANLQLKPSEHTLQPPGISVLLGGTPQEAANLIRAAFPDPVQHARLHAEATSVGSTTAAAIRQAGFEVVPAPTRRLRNHGRLIHPQGTAGLTEANREQLSRVFQETPTPGS
jgi:hypothetical protein